MAPVKTGESGADHLEFIHRAGRNVTILKVFIATVGSDLEHWLAVGRIFGSIGPGTFEPFNELIGNHLIVCRYLIEQ